MEQIQVEQEKLGATSFPGILSETFRGDFFNALPDEEKPLYMESVRQNFISSNGIKEKDDIDYINRKAEETYKEYRQNFNIPRFTPSPEQAAELYGKININSKDPVDKQVAAIEDWRDNIAPLNVEKLLPGNKEDASFHIEDISNNMIRDVLAKDSYKPGGMPDFLTDSVKRFTEQAIRGLGVDLFADYKEANRFFAKNLVENPEFDNNLSSQVVGGFGNVLSQVALSAAMTAAGAPELVAPTLLTMSTARHMTEAYNRELKRTGNELVAIDAAVNSIPAGIIDAGPEILLGGLLNKVKGFSNAYKLATTEAAKKAVIKEYIPLATKEFIKQGLNEGLLGGVGTDVAGNLGDYYATGDEQYLKNATNIGELARSFAVEGTVGAVIGVGIAGLTKGSNQANVSATIAQLTDAGKTVSIADTKAKALKIFDAIKAGNYDKAIEIANSNVTAKAPDKIIKGDTKPSLDPSGTPIKDKAEATLKERLGEVLPEQSKIRIANKPYTDELNKIEKDLDPVKDKDKLERLKKARGLFEKINDDGTSAGPIAFQEETEFESNDTNFILKGEDKQLQTKKPFDVTLNDDTKLKNDNVIYVKQEGMALVKNANLIKALGAPVTLQVTPNRRFVKFKGLAKRYEASVNPQVGWVPVVVTGNKIKILAQVREANEVATKEPAEAIDPAEVKPKTSLVDDSEVIDNKDKAEFENLLEKKINNTITPTELTRYNELEKTQAPVVETETIDQTRIDEATEKLNKNTPEGKKVVAPKVKKPSSRKKKKAETPVEETVETPAIETNESDKPSSVLPVRATENVSPRPSRKGRDTTERDSWDENYGEMRKGGKTHNDDGTPYQPTVLDETIPIVFNQLKDKTFDERIDAIGSDIGAELSTTLKTLLNDGWIWDSKEDRMVNPLNKNENPLQGLRRLKKIREGSVSTVEPTVEPEPVIPTIETIDQINETENPNETIAEIDKALVFQNELLKDKTISESRRKGAERQIKILEAEKARIQPTVKQDQPTKPIDRGVLKQIISFAEKGDLTIAKFDNWISRGFLSEANLPQLAEMYGVSDYDGDLGKFAQSIQTAIKKGKVKQPKQTVEQAIEETIAPVQDITTVEEQESEQETEEDIQDILIREIEQFRKESKETVDKQREDTPENIARRKEQTDRINELAEDVNLKSKNLKIVNKHEETGRSDLEYFIEGLIETEKASDNFLVTIILDNIIPHPGESHIEAAERIFKHEVVGHLKVANVLKGISPKAFDNLVTLLKTLKWRSGDNIWERTKAAYTNESIPDDVEITDEIFARLVESKDKESMSLLKKIAAKTRIFLLKNGLAKNWNINDIDIIIQIAFNSDINQSDSPGTIRFAKSNQSLYENSNIRGYGAWIAPNGKVIDVGYQDHLGKAIDIIGEEAIEGMTVDQVYSEMGKRGYLRVINGSSILVDEQYSLTPTHKKVLEFAGINGDKNVIIGDKYLYKTPAMATRFSRSTNQFDFRLADQLKDPENVMGLVVAKDGTLPSQNLAAKIKKSGATEFEVDTLTQLVNDLSKNGRVDMSELSEVIDTVPTVVINKLGVNDINPKIKRFNEIKHTLDSTKFQFSIDTTTGPTKIRITENLENGDVIQITKEELPENLQSLYNEVVSLDITAMDWEWNGEKSKSQAATGKYGVDPYSNEQLKGEEIEPGHRFIWSGDLSLNVPLEKQSEEQRVAEIKRLKKEEGFSDEEIAELDLTNYKPSSAKFTSQHYSGEVAANQLAFVRGGIHEYQTGNKLPDGTIASKPTRVFEIWEVQSDWDGLVSRREERIYKSLKKSNAQGFEENDWEYEDANGRKRFLTASNENEALGKLKRDLNIFNDDKTPLLKYWESLALKAAVNFAQEQGADKIITSDAETAMITEGHDKYAIARFDESEIGNWTAIDENGNSIFSRNKSVKTKKEVEDAIDAYGEIGRQTIYQIKKEDTIVKVSQAPGMEAAYDERIPNGLKKITGSQPKKVTVGKHGKGKSAVFNKDTNTGYMFSVPQNRGLLRFSKSQPNNNINDQKYLAAVESGDLDTAQKMVDEAAKRAGFTETLYHGSPDKNITTFRESRNKQSTFEFHDYGEGVYLTKYEKSSDGVTGADHYTSLNERSIDALFSEEKENTGKVYKLYAKLNKPVIAENSPSESEWSSIKEYVNKNGGRNTLEVFEEIIEDTSNDDITFGELLYDEVSRIVKRALSVLGYDGVYAENGEQIVVWNNNQIKSSDPVTKDDQGNVIPLSQRFSNSPDIRFSKSQIRTADFKEWFGDWEKPKDEFSSSKVVDEKGEPLVVYHGTENDKRYTEDLDFTVFYPLSHFGTAKAANERVDLAGELYDNSINQRIYPVYLNIRNPIEMIDNGAGHMSNDFRAELIKQEIISSEAADKFTREYVQDLIKKGTASDDPSDNSERAIIALIKSLGYDGFKYTNNVEDKGSISWVALYPNQIKSATGNTGKFSNKNPDIRFSKSQPKQKAPVTEQTKEDNDLDWIVTDNEIITQSKSKASKEIAKLIKRTHEQKLMGKEIQINNAFKGVPYAFLNDNDVEAFLADYQDFVNTRNKQENPATERIPVDVLEQRLIDYNKKANKNEYEFYASRVEGFPEFAFFKEDAGAARKHFQDLIQEKNDDLASVVINDSDIATMDAVVDLQFQAIEAIDDISDVINRGVVDMESSLVETGNPILDSGIPILREQVAIMRKLFNEHALSLITTDATSLSGGDLRRVYYSLLSLVTDGYPNRLEGFISSETTDIIRNMEATFSDPYGTRKKNSDISKLESNSSQIERLATDGYSYDLLTRLQAPFREGLVLAKRYHEEVITPYIESLQSDVYNGVLDADMANKIGMFGILRQRKLVESPEEGFKASVQWVLDSNKNTIGVYDRDFDAQGKRHQEYLEDNFLSGINYTIENGQLTSDFTPEDVAKFYQNANIFIGDKGIQYADGIVKMYDALKPLSKFTTEFIYGRPFEEIENYIPTMSVIIKGEGDTDFDIAKAQMLTDAQSFSSGQIFYGTNTTGLGSTKSRTRKIGTNRSLVFNINYAGESLGRIAVYDYFTAHARQEMSQLLNHKNKNGKLFAKFLGDPEQKRGRTDAFRSAMNGTWQNVMSQASYMHSYHVATNWFGRKWAQGVLSGLHQLPAQLVSNTIPYFVQHINEPHKIGNYFKAATYLLKHRMGMLEPHQARLVDKVIFEVTHRQQFQEIDKSVNLDINPGSLVEMMKKEMPYLYRAVVGIDKGIENILFKAFRLSDTLSGAPMALAEYLNAEQDSKGTHVRLEDLTYDPVSYIKAIDATERYIGIGDASRRGEYLTNKDAKISIARNLLIAFRSFSINNAVNFGKEMRRLFDSDVSREQKAKSFKYMMGIAAQSVTYTMMAYAVQYGMASAISHALKNPEEEEELKKLYSKSQNRMTKNERRILNAEISMREKNRKVIQNIQNRTNNTRILSIKTVKDAASNMVWFTNLEAIPNVMIHIVSDGPEADVFKAWKQGEVERLQKLIKRNKALENRKTVTRLNEELANIQMQEFLPAVYEQRTIANIGGSFGGTVEGIVDAIESGSKFFQKPEAISPLDFVNLAAVIGVSQPDIKRYFRASSLIEKSGKEREEQLAAYEEETSP